MSTTIDSKVVEMKFDNSRFEKNVATSMSTLDKLKEKLNLTGASKGLEEIDSAAKKVNMSGLGTAVETVQAKFSALEVMGVTALANITNQAVNAAKRLAAEFTITPLKTGFNEYELKMGSIQTIMASTGESLEKVNKYLDELNTYSDKTIYSFQDMTSNIGKFTNAGVKLDDAVAAMKGVSNEAAVSGANANEASRAMYNFAQALSAGYVKLIDWKSIENANMATVEFKNQLIETGLAMGTVVKEGDRYITTTTNAQGKVSDAFDATHNFNEALANQWMTTEVLTETLKHYSVDIRDMTDAEIEAYEAQLKSQGFTEEQIKNIEELGKKAYDSAQDVKTFSMMMDTLKEAAQSGWARTWELIFGDFEQGKKLWTGLANFFGDIIDKSSKFRNDLLESALGKTFTDLVDKIKNVTKPIENTTDSIKKVVDSVKDYANIVNEILGGKWGNGQERWDKLTKAGYDWAHAQNLVNEKLGNSVRHATDYVEAQKKVSESQDEVTESQDKTTESQEKLSDSTIDFIVEMTKLSDAELKAKGYTDDQIKAFRELAEAADKTGIPLKEFLKNIDEIDGRYLLLNGFKNIGQSIVTIFKAIGAAYRDAFPPMSSDQLFNIIAGFHKLTTHLVISDETADKLTRTFKGVFAVIGMVTDVLGGGFKIAFKAVTAILGYFDMDILDVTAHIGDALVTLRKATDLSKLFGKAISFAAPYVKKFIDYIAKLGKSFMQLSGVNRVVTAVQSLFEEIRSIDLSNIDLSQIIYSIPEKIKEVMESLKGTKFYEIGKFIIEGLSNGIGNGAFGVVKKIIQVGKDIITYFCTILGIHSPSTVFFEFGNNIIQGLVNGLKNGASSVYEFIKGIADKCIAIFKSINWENVFAAGIVVTVAYGIKKISDAFQTLAAPLEGLGGIFASVSKLINKNVKNVGKVLKSFANVMNSFAFNMNAKAFKNIAISLALIIGSVALLAYIINKNEGMVTDLWHAVGIVAVLAVILVGLAWAIGQLSKSSVDLKNKTANIQNAGLTLLGIAGSLALVAVAIKLIGNMNQTQFEQGMKGLAAIAGSMIGILAICKLLSKGQSSIDFAALGALMASIGMTMLKMAAVVKILGMMDPGELTQGTIFIGLFSVLIVGLMAATKLITGSKNIEKIGGALLKIAGAIAIMAFVAKLIGDMNPNELMQGTVFIGLFSGIIVGLMAATKLITGSKNIDKIGSALIGVAAAIGVMGLIVKLLGGMNSGELIQGILAITAFCGIIVGLMWATKLINGTKNIDKIGGTLFKIAAAIGIMALVAFMLSLISVGDLAKGTIVIAAFAGIMVGLMAATKLITGSKNVDTIGKTLLAVAGAIAILAGIAVLLGLVPLKNLIQGTIIVAVLATVMAGLIAVTHLAKKSLGNIIALTVMMGVLTGLIYLLTKMDLDSAVTAATLLGGLALAMSGSLYILSLVGNSAKNAAKGVALLTAMAIPLLAFVGVLALMQNVQTAISNVMALVILAGACSLLLLPLSLVGAFKEKAFIGVLALTAMALPLLAFVGVLALMQNVQNATNNVMALVTLATACTLLLIPLTIIGAIAMTGIGAGAIIAGILALTAMAIPMLAFIGVLALMSNINTASANAELLIDLMTTMTDLLVKVAIVAPLAALGVAAMSGLTLLMGAIGVMAVAIGALMDKFPSIQQFLDTGLPVLEQLASSIGRMVGNFIGGIGEGLGDSLVQIGNDIATFMSTISTASVNASMIKPDAFDGVKALMAVMLEIGATTVGTSIGDIFTFGGTSMDKFQTDGVAFFNAMKAIGEASSNANINVEAMNAIIGVATSLAKLQSSLEPIGGVITWFTGRDDLGTFGVNAGLFVSAMKHAFGSLDGVELNTEAMSSIISAATSLATLQNSLEPIGGVISWFSGRDDLATFGINIGYFIRSIINAFSSLEETTINVEVLNSIISACTSLATLQNSLEPIGGVISWFTGRDDLATFGVNIGHFIRSMINAFGSLEDVKINTVAMESIIQASTSLAKLQSSLEPIGGVVSWFAGRSDLGTFGVSIGQFISSMKTAMLSLEGIEFNNAAAMDSIINAAKSLASLQSSLEPMGGVVSWFAGRSDLGTFGTNIGLFADAMGKLKTGMGENGIPETVVTSVINAGNAIIELQKALPEEGWFDGKMNLTEFSNYVNDFANAMSSLGQKAAEIDPSAVSNVISTAYRIKSLITSLVDLDTSGLAAFTGVGTGGFGADGAAYKIAQAIAAFSNNVADIDTTAVSVSVYAAQRLKSLINSLASLDTSGVELFKPQTIGSAMKSYADKVAGIDTTLVSTSISAAQRLRNFINSLVGLDSTGVANFKPQSIASAIKNYANNVADIDIFSITLSISAAQRIKTFIASLAGLDTSGVGSFKSAIANLSSIETSGLVTAFQDLSKFSLIGANIVNAIITGISSKTEMLYTIGNTLVTRFVSGITSRMGTVNLAMTTLVSMALNAILNRREQFRSAGVLLMNRFASGITSQMSAVRVAVSNMVSYAISTMRGYYGDFYNVGSYLVDGFANGISENSYKAVAQSKAMANAAARAAKEALDINSPSKVFRSIGYSVPEGFAMGIDRMTGMVKASSIAMTDVALDGVNNTISNLAAAISTDIDAQPTIRPVLDLDNVRSGASAISDMFNGGVSVNALSNVGAINKMMAANSQNGANDGIISAINKLRDDLNNSGNTYYTIDGITYDNGSEVAEAITALTRAIKIEGRV